MNTPKLYITCMLVFVFAVILTVGRPVYAAPTAEKNASIKAEQSVSK